MHNLWEVCCIMGMPRNLGGIFFILLIVVSSSLAQGCTPANNSHGTIIPSGNLPTQGVRLYFQEASEMIPSFLMLRASQIEPIGFISTSSTRALWCQSANNDSNNGTWFEPPGVIPPGFSVVSTEDVDAPTNEPYQIVRCTGEVGLIRDTGVRNHEGLLQCVIRDENNDTHTLTVGVYTGIVYDNYAGPLVDMDMQFSLTSLRDADPPQFTLSFNSSFGPPTMVDCTVDGSSFNYTVSREVKSPQFIRNGDLDSVNNSIPDTLDVTEVMVRVKQRQGGVYRCNVTVVGRSDSKPRQVVILGTGASTVNIAVAGTPTNVTASRTTLTSILVSWTAPSPKPDGYMVFYQVAGNDATRMSNFTTSSGQVALNLTSLSGEETYSIFVIATNDINTLPGPRSVIVSAPPAVSVNFSTSGCVKLGSVDFSLSCTVTVNVSVTRLNVTVLDSANMTRNNTIFTNLSAGSSFTVTVSIMSLSTHDAGQYLCVASAEDSDGGSATVSGIGNVTVQPFSKRLASISVSLDPQGTPLLAGTKRSLICAVKITDCPAVSVRFIWWKNGGALPVDGRVTNTTLGNTSTLEFNPMWTSDGAQYQCVAELLGTAMNLYDVIDLNVTIPPPQLIPLTLTPSTTPLYEGTAVNLTCSASLNTSAVNSPFTVSSVWTGPSGEQLTNSSSRITIVDMLQYPPYYSVLMFDPVDDVDTGVYQCNISVNSSNSRVLSSSNTANGTLNITALPDPVVSITTAGFTEAGQNLSLICTVTMEAGLVTRPTVTWVKVAQGSVTIPSTTTETTHIIVLTLPFTPLTFSHRGVYKCVVDLNISSVFSFNAEEEYNITVQLPPPMMVSVQPDDGSLMMVAGTARNLTCTINLTNVDDINVMANFTWRADGGYLPSLPRLSTFGNVQSGNQTSFTSTLIFNPLDNSTDSGQYLCAVRVDSVPADTFITPINTSNTINITVEPLPPPTVKITTNGTVGPGSTLTLTCEVGVVEGLVVEPDIVWSKRDICAGNGSTPEFNNISVEAMGTGNTLRLQFNPVNTSDAGVYTCTATVAVEAINVTVSNSSMVDIRLQTPGPPKTFTATATMTSIMLHWQPPTQPNGIIIIIIGYRLIVQLKSYYLEPSVLSYLECSLQPGQHVTASISAITIAGVGPAVTMSLTTEQGFSGVEELTAMATDGDALNISWSPPSRPHGFITRYRVVVENNNTEVRSAHRTESVTNANYSLTDRLSGGVPYYITVTPLDSCNSSGDSRSIVNFTWELSPIVAPVFNASRSENGTVITISWQPITLEQARGFFIYRVTLTPVVGNKWQAVITTDVPRTQTSVTVSNLDPGVEYAVTVGMVNINNKDLTGPTLRPLTVTTPSTGTLSPAPGLLAGLVVGCVVLAIILVGGVIIIALLVRTRWRSANTSWSSPEIVYDEPALILKNEEAVHNEPNKTRQEEVEMNESRARYVTHQSVEIETKE